MADKAAKESMTHFVGNISTENFSVPTILLLLSPYNSVDYRGGPALTRWDGWSAGLVGRQIKCRRRKWNGGGGPGALG